MGQYWLLVCNEKETRQYLDPEYFGDSATMLDFSRSTMGFMAGWAVLLAGSNGQTSSDLRSKHPIVGSWVGKGLVLAGDEAEHGEHLSQWEIDNYKDDHYEEVTQSRDEDPNAEFKVTLYMYAKAYFINVSDQVLEAMAEDPRLLKDLQEKLRDRARMGPKLPAALEKKLYGGVQKSKALRGKVSSR